MADVLELMLPSTSLITAYDEHAEVESLGFLDWFRFDGLVSKCLTAILEGGIADSLELMIEANELAAGLSASVNADEGLAAFFVLTELNELRYMDEDLLSLEGGTFEELEDSLRNSSIVEVVTTLASRFSMNEIERLTPEFAILCWQRIREEVAESRNVIFYSSELGYRKGRIGKGGKYKLSPLASPYTPPWSRKKIKRRRRKRLEMQKDYMPKFVTRPDLVIDGKSRKRLGEILSEQKGGKDEEQKTGNQS